MHKATIVLRSNLERSSEQSFDLKGLTLTKRVQNGLKASGIYLVFALLALSVPALHLILAPLFFLMAAHEFYETFRVNQEVMTDSQVSCFVCGNTFNYNHHLAQWPITTDCPHCQAQYRVKA